MTIVELGFIRQQKNSKQILWIYVLLCERATHTHNRSHYSFAEHRVECEEMLRLKTLRTIKRPENIETKS